MGTAVILLVLLTICIFAVKSSLKRLRGGCCGGGSDMERRQPPLDGDRSHYFYEYTLSVGGMTCKNCAAHVENAFHRQEGFWAKADLRGKRVSVLTKEPKEEADLCRIVTQAGYEFLGSSAARQIS